MTELVSRLPTRVNVSLAELVDFVWVDFETNGLHKDGPVVPFEVGLKATDINGEVFAETNRIILPRNWQAEVSELSEYVHNMHTESGLIEDMAAAHSAVEKGMALPVHPGRIDSEIHRWLTIDLGLPEGKYPMCGSTVHFDRRVMEEHMPRTHNWFHYRNIDISTIKELCRQLNPPVYAGRPTLEKKAHRPLADIDASIEEYLFYRANFLFVA